MRLLMLIALALVVSVPASASDEPPCFMTAGDFTPLLASARKQFDGEVSLPEAIASGGLFETSAAVFYIQGVADGLDEGLWCHETVIYVQDLLAIIERRWKPLLDEHDVVLSQTCAVDVIATILAERFPCKGLPTPPPPPPEKKK